MFVNTRFHSLHLLFNFTQFLLLIYLFFLFACSSSFHQFNLFLCSPHQFILCTILYLKVCFNQSIKFQSVLRKNSFISLMSIFIFAFHPFHAHTLHLLVLPINLIPLKSLAIMSSSRPLLRQISSVYTLSAVSDIFRAKPNNSREKKKNSIL